MSLRVAIVAPYDLSVPGGVNTQIRGQARALRQIGHTVDVFGPASGPLSGGEHALGRAVTITMGGTESGLGLDPRALAAVARLGRGPFDVIHVHEPLTPLVPWLVVAAAHAPLVGTFHVHREAGHRLYALWKRALTPLARRLRARLAVSDAARRTVATHFPGDYEIVPNGIDVEDFRRPRSRPRALAPDRRVVLYVGRLEPRKGVDTLIRAMTSVQKTVPDVTLVIVGDGSERVPLAALAGSSGAVHFAGRVADAELAAYIQAADVVCSPAIGGESFGIVLLEAMACGKPIVASRIEGYEALVDKAGCALLVAPGDAEALARELTALLASPDTQRRLGRAGAAAALEYDWPGVALRLDAIYRRVVGAARNDGDHTRLRSIK
jgi:phosphatidylinositol alpha-mannosyltransferase